MFHMGERDAAQAAELVRALCELVDRMTRRLIRLECQGSQLDAAVLRRDIHDAQTHINQLESRYRLGTRNAVTPLLTQQAR